MSGLQRCLLGAMILSGIAAALGFKDAALLLGGLSAGLFIWRASE